jgi:hypothetical protein
MTQRRKYTAATVAILISVCLGIASRMWPRSAEDELVETSISDLITSLSLGDALKARVLFALPDGITDAKLEELSNVLRAGNRSVQKTTYLGSAEGKIGDHPVLSSTFLLKHSNDTESLMNTMSALTSWNNSKPFIMSMTISDNVAAARKAVAFMPTENGMRSYFLLLMGIAALAISTYAVYRALILRPKYWLGWVILSLIGVLRFRLNWATEEYDVQIASVAIPVFEMVRTSILSPFLFTFGVPVGAIAFLNHVSGIEDDKPHDD